MIKVVRDLGWLYLIGLAVVAVLFQVVGTRWWPVTVLLFSPRWVFAVPALGLVPLTLLVRARHLCLYPIHAWVLLFPIMGFQIPSGQIPSGQVAGGQVAGGQVAGGQVAATDSPAVSIRVISYNMGGGEIEPRDLVRLATTSGCELLLLQECPPELADRIASGLGWDVRWARNLAIASPHPMGESEILVRQAPEAYNAVAAMACDVDFPGGRVWAVSVHLPTLRPGLQRLISSGLAAATSIEAITEYHDGLSGELRDVVAARAHCSPVIGGDFNMPVEGDGYRRHWGAYRNAFTEAGSGFGYTKYTRWHGVRIDHVLTDEGWTPRTAWAGPALGGDHRPLVVELGRSA